MCVCGIHSPYLKEMAVSEGYGGSFRKGKSLLEVRSLDLRIQAAYREIEAGHPAKGVAGI